MDYLIAMYLSIVILCVAADSKRVQSNPHIVGGKSIDIRDLPYIVSIRFNGAHFCGGSIYSPRAIVTAAHCVVNKALRNITVVAGSTYLTEEVVVRKVMKAILHPNFDDESKDFDVAIVLLEKPLIFRESIKPIKLARKLPPNGAKVIIAGWGYQLELSGNSNSLQVASLTFVSNKYCNAMYKGMISSRMVCAHEKKHDKDACQNDSGGPLTYEGELLGIVSFGIGCATEYPGVYTSIPEVSKWIYSIHR